MTDVVSCLSGPIALLPTFFEERGLSLDCQARHAERLLRAGCRAMVVGGAEGEGPTLDDAESERLVRCLVQLPSARALGFSIWTPCTRTALRQAAKAEQAGANFLVVSPPPYNRPTQDGVRRHVESISSATPLPVILRDDPSRTRIGLSDETLALLGRTGIAAIALAPGDTRRADLVDHESRGRVAILSGSDFDAVLGQCDPRRGWLSSVMNVDPERCCDLQKAHLADDWRSAARLSRELCRLLRALDLGEPAVTIKYALSRIGEPNTATRLPLVPLAADAAHAIDAALEAIGALSPPVERRAAASI